MQSSRKELRSARVYTAPLFGIVVLLTCYWLLADWQRVPAIIWALFDIIHLPH
jgi:hypothetical protein